MRRALIFLVTLVVCVSGKSGAQEMLPVYSDYLTENLYLLHPSMAGASESNRIRLTARQQWFDLKDAPGLQTLSIHGRIKDKIGIGGIMFNDHNGNYATRGAFATFAYHLMFSRSEVELNQLSFGISGGFLQHQLNAEVFQAYDPILNGTGPDASFGSLDLGLSYYYHEFFAHITAKGLLSIAGRSMAAESYLPNYRQYFFSAGYVITREQSPWGYEPSFLINLRESTGELAVDFNAKAYHRNGFFGGISYRRSLESALNQGNGDRKLGGSQYLIPFVGFDLGKLLFAYTYSYQTNRIILSNGGFHQITLGYDFGKNRRRYDCTCPAVR